jgi:hypothetical protein
MVSISALGGGRGGGGGDLINYIRFGAIDITKPYEFIGFGAMDATKPYEFTGFGAISSPGRSSEEVISTLLSAPGSPGLTECTLGHRTHPRTP